MHLYYYLEYLDNIVGKTLFVNFRALNICYTIFLKGLTSSPEVPGHNCAK